MTIVQLPLSFEPERPRYARSEFIVGDANKEALSLAETWAQAREDRLLICGPQGSGKTHLASIVTLAAERADPKFPFQTHWGDGAALAALDFGAAARLVVIDNADCAEDGRELLSVIEKIRICGARLVLIGRDEPRLWARGLRDLETRLLASPRVTLHEPDEELMRAVIQKLFIDRQLKVDPSIAAYAAPRLARTFAAAQVFVAAVDEAAVERGAAITKPLAGRVIGRLSADVADD